MAPLVDLSSSAIAMQSELVILCLYLLNANTQYQVNSKYILIHQGPQYYCVCNTLLKYFYSPALKMFISFFVNFIINRGPQMLLTKVRWIFSGTDLSLNDVSAYFSCSQVKGNNSHFCCFEFSIFDVQKQERTFIRIKPKLAKLLYLFSFLSTFCIKVAKYVDKKLNPWVLSFLVKHFQTM